MKKYLILVAGISLLFFSCASKPEESDSIVLNLGKGSSENSNINEIGSPDSKTEDIGQAPNMTGEINLNSSGSSDIGDLNSYTDISGQFETTVDTVSEILETTSDSNNTTNNSESATSLEDEINMLADPEVIDLEYVEESVPVTLVPAEEKEEDIESIQQTEDLSKTEKTELSSTENDKTKTDKTSVSTKPGKKTVVVTQDDDEIIDLTLNNSPDDILEILDPDSDASPEEAEPVIIIPSRKVTLKIGQTLEVMYPGSGWIYMGTTDSTKDITFLGKKLGTQNTKFTFTAKAEGTKILHFYKNDALTENYIDDYLEVEILKDKDIAKTTVPAPAYKNPIPKKVIKEPVIKTETEIQKLVETKPVETNVETKPSVTKTQVPSTEPKNNISKEIEKTPVVPEPIKEESKIDESKPEISEAEVSDLLKQAHNLYNTKEYKDALNKIKQFFEFSTKKRDEAFFLQGQIYEADSSIKNIKLAIDSYKNVTKNYPASPYWDDANKRIIYLTKFYLEGR